MGKANQNETKQESLIVKAGIAGVSCAVVSGILNPFDVTKIRMQNQGQQKLYNNAFHGIQRIFKEEGVRGLLKGMEASMIREVTYSGMRIGGYEPIRKLLSAPGKNPADTNPLVKLFSALMSGAIGSAIANPLDLIKTRMQAVLPNQPIPYRNTFQALGAIYSQGRFGALYKGWVVTSSRAAVLTSSQLGSYDSIKHNFLMKAVGMEDGIKLHLSASFLAGLLTTTATNPCKPLDYYHLLVLLFLPLIPLIIIVDVIKTRYLSDQKGIYSGIIDCVVKSYRADGIAGFFKVSLLE